MVLIGRVTLFRPRAFFVCTGFIYHISSFALHCWIFDSHSAYAYRGIMQFLTLWFLPNVVRSDKKWSFRWDNSHAKKFSYHKWRKRRKDTRVAAYTTKSALSFALYGRIRIIPGRLWKEEEEAEAKEVFSCMLGVSEVIVRCQGS